MKKITCIILFFLVNFCFANFWSHDKWDSTDGLILKYDKLEHALGTSVLYLYFRELGINEKNSTEICIITSICWEVKDAILPYEKYGIIGGDGFSTKDLCFNFLGLYITKKIEKLINKRLDRKRTNRYWL